MRANGPTLSDVATHAGVSLATASRALNGSARRVNPELEERVLVSARVLGYSANIQAQAVARGMSTVVALVVGDIADPYFAAIASGVIRVADERGLIVTITATGADAGTGSAVREEAALLALRGHRPRAIVLAGSRVVGAEVPTMPGDRIAAIGAGAPGLRAVAIDNRGGAAALARELRRLGYRDFAVLAGSEQLVTVCDRVGGFRREAPGAAVWHAEFSREGGYRAMTELLASGARPECVFAVTDVMALGAMVALRDAGLQPGTDIAVAGFDDLPLVADVTPALTSVALPLADIGARALELALAEEPGGEPGGELPGVPGEDLPGVPPTSAGLPVASPLDTPIVPIVRLRASTPPR